MLSSTSMLRKIECKDEEQDDVDEEVQEKENEEKEQARMSGIVIVNIDF
mgnify:CR=1 FL=1